MLHTAAAGQEQFETQPGDAGLLVPSLLSPRRVTVGLALFLRSDCPLLPWDGCDCQTDLPPLYLSTAEGWKSP